MKIREFYSGVKTDLQAPGGPFTIFVPIMKKIPAFIITSLLIALSFVQAEAGAAPELAIEKTSHDFGDLFTGEEFSHVFRIRNVGTGPLELSDTPLRVLRSEVRTLAPGSAFQLLPVKTSAALRSPT